MASSPPKKYPKNFEKWGNVLIINNKTFSTKGFDQRNSTKQDVDRMDKVLKNLGFNVIIRQDQTVKQMKNLFGDIREADHTKNSCFLAVIMSHGDEGDLIYGTDGKFVTITELIEQTLPDKCAGLTGKPKLFFIQACRGTKVDPGVEECDALGSKEGTKVKIPVWADVLISYSSPPGYYSFRNNSEGSWYIQSLAEVFEQHASNEDLLTLLTRVNDKVAHEFESKTGCKELEEFDKSKQMPTFDTKLTRQFYF